MNSFKKKSSIFGLVLTRREGECISINHGEVLVEVVEIRGNAVRLAFKASRDISIRRGEIEGGIGEVDQGRKRAVGED